MSLINPEVDVAALLAAYERAIGELYNVYLADTLNRRNDPADALEKFRQGLERHRVAFNRMEAAARESAT